jgi:hypothetical protein
MSKVPARWPLLTLLCCTAAFGQLSGRFYFEKNKFAVGEPVFLYFEVTNTGTEPQDINRANPYTPCAGYDIKLSTDPNPTSSCAILPRPGSCASSSMPLERGAKHVERILLNYERKSIEPGDHEVEAVRRLEHVPRGVQLLPLLAPVFEVHDHVHFFVDPNTRFGSKELQVWVDQVRSEELQIRADGGLSEELWDWVSQGRRTDLEEYGEAVRVLASLAPPSLEDTLIDFATSGKLWGDARLAMARLNTPRSRAVLADMLRTGRPGSPERYEAANFLASSGDPQWFPLLLADAQKQPGGNLYPAAENGGDRAVPFLVDLIHSDTELRLEAIGAMGHTGSRAAVPILLDLLRSADAKTAECAMYALQALTRRAFKGAVDSPQSQYPIWQAWWSREGATARIYKPTDCSETVPLQ